MAQHGQRYIGYGDFGAKSCGHKGGVTPHYTGT